MMKKFYVIPLLLALFTVLTPIIYNHFQSESEIQLQITSISTLLENKSNIDNLKIFYDEKEIDKLTKYHFILINSGNTPIVSSDIISPINISFGDSSEILNVEWKNKSVNNLDFTSNMIDSNKGLELTFPLFNKDDFLSFNVLVEGEDQEVLAEARIKKINKILIIDKCKEFREEKKVFPWVAVIIGIYSLLGLCLPFVMHKENERINTIKNKYKSVDDLPTHDVKDKYISFAKEALEASKYNDLLKALTFLSDGKLDEKQIEKIKEILFKKINNEKKTSIQTMIIVFALALWGLFYVTKSLGSYFY